MKLNKNILLFTALLVVLQVTCKVLFADNFAWSGFSPMIAIALFSGMIIRKKSLLFLLPLLSLLISDVVLQVLYEQGLFKFPGFYPYQLINYSILMLAVLAGVLFSGKSYRSLAAGTILAPTFFFLVSNFSVWAGGEVFYSKDFNGLMQCYAAGLPFYRNALLATLVFFPVILFAYNYLTAKKARLIVA